jgi:hypothetical protein
MLMGASLAAIPSGFAQESLTSPAGESHAQVTPPLPADPAERDEELRGVRLKSLPKNLLQDQEALFTTPLRLNERQWKLTIPLAVMVTTMVASDTAAEAHVSTNATTVSHAKTFSDAGLGMMVGAGGGMYLWGKLARDEKKRETGFLSGEAATDAFIDTELIKTIAGRDRPFTSNGRGDFFNGGASFPSEHAAVSWAIASVIAHEYPGPMTKMLTYGLAGAVSAARVEAHQHFVSDAAIGSALGWYIGRQVYRARSSAADIDPRRWGRFVRDERDDELRQTSEMGSSYVPVGSWIYEAFGRLAAMGYLPRSSMSVRPWTRLSCAQMLLDAEQFSESFGEPNAEAAGLLAELGSEFDYENGLIDGGVNRRSSLENLYTRFTGISGTPLRDSYHFGQTLVDDYGRPYGKGANAIAGFTTRSEAGPFAIYFQGEYQYASSIAPYNATAQQVIAAYDSPLPYGWATRSGTTSRVRPVEAYAALNISDWQLSFGQQALWWGPDSSTSMMLSNNAGAMPMVRLARVEPLTLPPLLRWLGPTHADFFFAREGGIHYVQLGTPNHYTLHGNAADALTPPPYIWGLNLSFKPTENFELGFAHDAIFAGYGRPLNLKTFLHTFSQLGNGQAIDPGKRTTEFNVSYHVPGLRRYLVVYSEAFAYDNPVEGAFPQRFAVDPGIYLPQLPGAHKMDLRVEGANTNLPGLKEQAYFYANAHYAQGYTNYGQIFGSWIGRQGSGGVATSNYWFTARNKATISYRRMNVDKSYLQGGQLEDFSGSLTWMLRPSIEFSATSQYESWKFPLLATGTRSNVATIFGFRFFPNLQAGAQ